MSDTLMRQWQMLRLIPRHPSKVSTSQLVHSLSDAGFQVSQRTLQRDLLKLSEIYPLVSSERSKPFGWSWSPEASVMDIPGMDSHTALAFWLADQHLSILLPKTTLHKLQPHFEAAADLLNKISHDKGIAAWRNKVRVLHSGPNLKLPVIDKEVQNKIYDALLKNRRLSVTYHPRNSEKKEYELNPLGLVFKDGISYMVCSIWDYNDIRLLTLHRIKKAEVMNIPLTIPENFDLDEYIASGELNFVVNESIKFKALFSKGAAFHLDERPLSDDQTIFEQNDNKILLTANIQDTKELRWWLLGFGDQVEVLEPKALRSEIMNIIQSAAKLYSSN